MSASAGRAAFDADDPLGKAWSPDGSVGGPTVIGVVENNTLASLRDPGAVESYRLLTDETIASAVVIARTNGDGPRPAQRFSCPSAARFGSIL